MIQIINELFNKRLWLTLLTKILSKITFLDSSRSNGSDTVNHSIFLDLIKIFLTFSCQRKTEFITWLMRKNISSHFKQFRHFTFIPWRISSFQANFFISGEFTGDSTEYSVYIEHCKMCMRSLSLANYTVHLMSFFRL